MMRRIQLSPRAYGDLGGMRRIGCGCLIGAVGFGRGLGVGVNFGKGVGFDSDSGGTGGASDVDSA